jgi:transposase
MLGLEEWMDVQVLAKQGYSHRAIARQSGYSRNTVKKLLTLGGGAAQSRQYTPRGSKLEPYKAYLRDRYCSTGLSAVRLHAEIAAQGYAGAVDIVRRYVRTLRPQRTALAKATVRYETAPGEQAQVDWAHCGYVPTGQGTQRPVYAFMLVLGYSRLLEVILTTDMSTETLLRCHEAAFAAIGGCPATILYDNMTQVKLARATYNPLFTDFADHYGFAPRTHRVRRPRTKGKVERMVDYLKDNFIRGRTFADLAECRAQLRHWLDTTANVRIHATIQQRPIDVWAVEQPQLRPVAGIAPYRLTTRALRKVSTECWVHFQGSRYSVPPAQVGTTVLVELRQDQQRVVIRAKEVIVADHPRAATRGEAIADPAHLAALWQLTLAQTPPPPVPWQLVFAEAVAARPLSAYEALVS